MKTFWVEDEIKYDGSQLHSLYSYLTHKVLGNSIVSWVGECDVNFDHMVDGEDLLDQSVIRSQKMLHFIIEIFDENLTSGVSLQRLLATIVKDTIESWKSQIKLKRDGDDLFWNDKKLSVSIATSSPRSSLIHFGINVTNENTPVSTCALSDFEIAPTVFAKEIMNKFSNEFESIKTATQKVKWVK